MASEPRDPSTPLSAASRPVARVLPLLGLPHLDRTFDYLVKADQDATAVPGTKVRIRFSGRLVDAVLMERRSTTDHVGRLSYLDRVISPEVVYPERIAELIEQLADRYGATRSDLIRAAIPARHAGAEESDTTTDWAELGDTTEPDLSAWAAYEFGQSFVDAVLSGTTARAAWQIAPGEQWARALAALAVKVVLDGGGALLVVPDQRDVDALEAACRELVSAKQITVLTASQGPQARYRRYLSVLHGQGRLVIGTRSAAFAPVDKLRLAVIVHDGDDNLADPRAPYHHAREVLTTRSAIEGASLVVAGHSRTAEAQLLVNSGWAHDLVATRETLRSRSPMVRASADSEFEMMRDPRAGQARLPKVAFDAARRALDLSRPVLVQVPRTGYVPTLACGACRHPARCRACNGPLGLPDGGAAAVPTCRWCGRPETHFRCGECGSTRLRAVVLGAGRTAEELGRAFAQTRVFTSGGKRVLDHIEPGPALVVATPGAEPRIADGSRYGAALLLDTWALLGRQDLRASEDTLAKWTAVATVVESGRNGGEVIVTADPGLEVVQSLIRWDVVGAAQRELAARAEVGFPPAVHMAAIDGPSTSLDRMRELIRLPAGGEYLGPVPLPENMHLPGDYDEATFGPPQRLLIRTPLGPRSELGRALREAAVARSAHKDELPLRIQVDPVQVG